MVEHTVNKYKTQQATSLDMNKNNSENIHEIMQSFRFKCAAFELFADGDKYVIVTIMKLQGRYRGPGNICATEILVSHSLVL